MDPFLSKLLLFAVVLVALGTLPAQGRAERTREALTGLFSKNVEVARQAAGELREEDLDTAAMLRYQVVVQEHFYSKRDADSADYDIDVFKHTVSERDVTNILSRRLPDASPIRKSYIKDLHRSLRPINLPQLGALARDRDLDVRRQAMHSLCLVAEQTDQFRSVVALSLLEWSTVVETPRRKVRLPVRRKTGFPPMLAAILQRIETDGSMPKPFPKNWLLRWAGSAAPDGLDKRLLLKLLASGENTLRWIALRGLWHIPGEDVEHALKRHARKAEHARDRALAYYALAHINPAVWHAVLQTKAAAGPSLLSAALVTAPKFAVSRWADRTFRKDRSVVALSVKFLKRALGESQYFVRVLPAAVRRELVAVIERRSGELTADQVHSLIAAVPEARTKTVARAYLARLQPSFSAECDLAFLQIADEPALRTKLEGWLANPSTANSGLLLLGQLGAPEHGAALVKCWAECNQSPIILARSAASKDVVASLTATLKAAPLDEKGESEFAEALAALMAAKGLPERTAESLVTYITTLPELILTKKRAAWRRGVLRGEVDETLVKILRVLPMRRFPYLSLVRDAAVIKELRAMRCRPGADIHWAISELAVAGDKEAREEMRKVWSRKIYGWADSSSRYSRVLDADLDAVSAWIEEVETNCCRRIVANGALDEFLGYSVFAGYGLRTQHAAAVEWFARFRARLRWSHLARAYVIGP